MNKKRIIVCVVIVILFIVCYSIINTKYDRLARYPYGTESERKIIEDYLDDNEIEYIIEYSIDPSYFIEYIRYDKFNIYHIDQYKHFNNIFTDFDTRETIIIVERLILLNKANDNFYTAISAKKMSDAYKFLRTYL